MLSASLLIWLGSKHLNPFKQDVIDLFSRNRGGHVEHWLYSDTLRRQFSGSQLWHEFLKASTDYYVFANEVNLIAKIAPLLSTAVPFVDTVVDFGVGDGEAVNDKVVPILKGLHGVSSYIGVDLSAEFLKTAQLCIAAQFPTISAQGIQTDFFASSFALPDTRCLGLMLGSTVTNLDMCMGDIFPCSHVVERLSHLKGLMGKGNHLLISYDANADIHSIQAAYSDPYWKRFVTGIMYDVAPITLGDFSPAHWKHSAVWNEKAHVLHQCAEATQDMAFSIDKEAFEIAKGERFVTVNLFKFPAPLFQSMCKEAGFEVKDSYADYQNRMCLQLLRA